MSATTPHSFAEHAAQLDPVLPEPYTVVQIECKRHPGRSIRRGDDYCRYCGIHDGVPANFQVVTYTMQPTEVRQCRKRGDL